ncbi:DUF2515 domain-containing protein [Halalkalibacter urbisdiaboli]|uniref:DUF2515 domain-containing protein n=1 Tax=Halalkalibacter urbisdiaboli TaxID=1960589 RepID=UPI000B43A286|nr:DUF2515 domain-containing protein [Halalkalibacter urbisdiaboli]
MASSLKQDVLESIIKKTEKGNIDNISRTVFYEAFYNRNPEIRWALLAGLVSRNAGWNMTDLESKWFQKLLNENDRRVVFSTYERANWTIFQDAFPQLLIYEWSKKSGEPLFHFLPKFGVSRFMEREWKMFWERRDEHRLCTALIINEQNVIQKPVLEDPVYEKHVFSTLRYFLEEHAHFSYVLFPTRTGELYGFYVRNFRKVESRIWLGKQLEMLLFHPDIYGKIIDFQKHTVHTGSRKDYEQFLNWETQNNSPLLRLTYPIIKHEYSKNKTDWYKRETRALKKMFIPVKEQTPQERTNWVRRKQLELYYAGKIKDWLND